MLKILLNFVISVFVTTLLVTIASSQIILAEMAGFGLEVSFAQRLDVTLKDIPGLGPALIMLVIPGFLITFAIARYCQRFIGGNRNIWFSIAGFISLPGALYLMQYFMGATILASARTNTGMLVIACCCALGGLLYAILSSSSSSKYEG